MYDGCYFDTNESIYVYVVGSLCQIHNIQHRKNLKGRTCSDNMFTLPRIIEKRREFTWNLCIVKKFCENAYGK